MQASKKGAFDEGYFYDVQFRMQDSSRLCNFKCISKCNCFVIRFFNLEQKRAYDGTGQVFIKTKNYGLTHILDMVCLLKCIIPWYFA